MSQHYPALLIVVPLLTAFIISACSWFHKRSCFPLAILAMAFSTYVSFDLLIQVLKNGHVSYFLGGWEPPWGIAYEVDQLNGVVLVLVSMVGLLNLVATRGEIESRFSDRTGAFYTLYLLFLVGLMGIVVTGDLFNLYVLLEISSITGYALIAMGDQDRAPHASLNYVFMGTVGACFYLLGVGNLYIMTGSLNMADVATLLPSLFGSKAIGAAFIFCVVGVLVKMAFFPLHGWLPNAYTYAPSPASSLIAPLMTKVMVYVMIRIMFFVFTIKYTFYLVKVGPALVLLSCVAMVVGALFALAQRNMKKMLTYIIISEIGYMVGGVWLENRTALTGAILHLLNDGLMTFCVFLAAGAIGQRIKTLDLENLKGLFKKMPFTMAGLVAGGLSIIGVPPTCGFFSKWYLIIGAMEEGRYVFVVALLLSSLFNAILFFRIIEISFFEGESVDAHHHGVSLKMEEASITTIIPLLIVAGGLLVIGLYSGMIVSKIINPVVMASFG